MSRHKGCRLCVWGGLLISAALHGAVAAVLLQADPSAPPGANDREVDLDLSMFLAAAPGLPDAGPAAPETPAVAETPPEQEEPRSTPPEEAPSPAPVEPPAEPPPAVPPPSRAERPDEAKRAPAKPRRAAATAKRPPAAKPRPKKAEPIPRAKPSRADVAAAPSAKAPATATRSDPGGRSSGRTATGTKAGKASGAHSRAARASAEQSYLAALQRAISKQQKYPMSARRRQQTGVTTVAFVIRADGKLTQIRISGGSGHQALDQAAVEALYRLGRFKPLPESIGRQSWALRVPIRFDLR